MLLWDVPMGICTSKPDVNERLRVVVGAMALG